MPYVKKRIHVSKYNKKRAVKRVYRKKYTRNTCVMKRINALSRRVAGEVFKFESTPALFSNQRIITTIDGSGLYSDTLTTQQPLNVITPGSAYVYPMNWYYTHSAVTGRSGSGVPAMINKESVQNPNGWNVSIKHPIWCNTMPETNLNLQETFGSELQYRVKYLYINAAFNAGLNATENSDGLMRCVIIKDKQPTGGSCTWFNSNDYARSVFNASRIDAQLSPSSIGRFTIMYDRTIRFNTTNSYKVFKYYKPLPVVVRNSHLTPDTGGTIVSANDLQTSSSPCPVQRNAYYLMIFTDGLPELTYTDASTTDAGKFHLFNRVAYYNN